MADLHASRYVLRHLSGRDDEMAVHAHDVPGLLGRLGKILFTHADTNRGRVRLTLQIRAGPVNFTLHLNAAL